MRFYFISMGIIALNFSAVSFASITDIPFGEAYRELKPDERIELKKGRPVVHLRSIAKAPWPEMTIYKRANLSPQESSVVEKATAIFADVDLHKIYIPKVIRSEGREKSKATLEVDYEVDLGKIAFFNLGRENYTVSNQVFSDQNKTNYLITWEKVRADRIQEIRGNVRFEFLPDDTQTQGNLPIGHVLIAYRNFIIPGGWIPNKILELASDRAKRQLLETVNAISVQIEEEISNPVHHDLLDEQVKKLRRLLERE